MDPQPPSERSDTPATPGAGPEEPPALEMQDVTIGSLTYAEQVMLEGVNWSVRRGDYWAIGGLQATGKSDLLATAAGLMRPLKGRYCVFGQELEPGYEHQLRSARLRIGLVFDGGRLLQHLTVAENILLALRYHQHLAVPELEGRLRDLLELIGLLRHGGSYPNALAPNWQQRVGLARALTLRPEVLLLDNPLTGLDPLHTWWWLGVLDQLSAGHPILENRPVTLVVTGDDLRPWKNHARQFAVLREKRLTVIPARPEGGGPPDAVLIELLGIESTKPMK